MKSKLRDLLINRLALLRTRFGAGKGYTEPLMHFLSQKKEPKKILFLCTGNICRSPYAAVRLRDLLAQRGIYQVLVSSAGTCTTPGEPADGAALEAARERGVNLGIHSTASISPDLLHEADLIFVMDFWQWEEINKSYGEYVAKTMFLGALLLEKGEPMLIVDPYGRGLREFHECYGKIDRALFELVRQL